MSDHFRATERTCLNGWWDFQPGGDAGAGVPADGWTAGRYLVPSFWTIPNLARKEGETYFAAKGGIFDAPDRDQHEFLFDAYGYPREWSRSRSGWLRRTLEVKRLTPARRYFLVLEALMPRGSVYVNGRCVGSHIHPTLPFEVDVTDALQKGDNEIAVRIEDYERDSTGRIMVPNGNSLITNHSGIWQDVWLVERGEVYLGDATIRTSTRQREISVDFEFVNGTDANRTIKVTADVRDWAKRTQPSKAIPAFHFEPFEVELAAGARLTHTITVPWTDAKWWSPEAPNLYTLATRIDCEGHELEMTYERFGFREVWVEGPAILLNGFPLHMFSDWGHKLTPFHHTEAWIRQWFGMIRDANMNHSRLHTHPHPRLYLDLADEEGILLTGETGLHGSGNGQAADEERYWEAAWDHARRFVRRDKNHPSLVLWSAGNEMRWNQCSTRLHERRLPELRKLFNELDPTRACYHEGDSSMWNEKTQAIISRHYYKACSGVGWWDRTQPLHSGEMSVYHYAGPNNTVQLGGDAVWADYQALDEAAAQDTAWIVESGRTLGVSCFGPWNLSCLENLRMEKEIIRPEYKDFTRPGVKPLQVMPHSSEFEFWKKGKGYTPNHSFAIQARAFRSLAVIDRSQRGGYFTGSTISRELFVVNDLPGEIQGSLEAALVGRDGDVYRESWDVTVARGGVVSRIWSVKIPDAAAGVCTLSVTFKTADARTLDKWSRKLSFALPGKGVAGKPLIKDRLAVFGNGSLRPVLKRLGLDAAYVETLDALSLAGRRILIIEKNAVQAGSALNRDLQRFARAGWRIIVMEQEVSIFPAMKLEDRPLQCVFVRAPSHGVVKGIKEDELRFWGDDPYPRVDGDTYVTDRMFRKNDAADTLFILDGDEGGFGDGGLDFAALVEVREGHGLILACQVKVTDKIDRIPAAEKLLVNMIRHAASPMPARSEPPIVIDCAAAGEEALAAALAAAQRGKKVVLSRMIPAACTAVSNAGGPALVLKEGEIYQAVRVTADPVLDGISNEDTCGIGQYSYGDSQKLHALIGTHFMAPGVGIEPLLVTPTRSGLKELFVYNGKDELLRMPMLSRFLHDEKPEEWVVLARVKLNGGEILINQFCPVAGADPRTVRVMNRLLANLGARRASSPLDGDCIAPQGRSPGYPQRVKILNRPVDIALRQEMVDSTEFKVEHIFSTPILSVPGWTEARQDDGVWSAADLNLDEDIYLYSMLVSKFPRKEVMSNLGVPNPEALTFLDLVGDGTVELTLNAQARPAVTLENGRATLADVPLEMGGNHVLIKWTPVSSASTLRLLWRNINMKPETGLVFW